MLEPSARSLAMLSLLLWMCSLGLTGFTTSGNVNPWLGYEILGAGWLGIADSNCAWFANPCLLWAGYAILKGRQAGYSACFAVLLACDSARLTQITVDEGGHTALVDAFGWGAVLWGLSTAVMLAAAGTRACELGLVSGTKPRGGVLRPLGLTLSVLIVALAAGVNAYDRKIGNVQERAALNRVAFKRIAICGAPEPVVTATLENLGGPLEVRMTSGREVRPWDSPEVLLEWGIPVVRYQDRDYSLLDSSEASIVKSTPASGPAAAVLSVSRLPEDDSIHLSLSDAATGRRLVAQTFTQAKPDAGMCPRYSASPGPADQPRKVLAQALHLSASAPKQDLLDFDHYWAIEGKLLAAQLLARGTELPGRPPSTNCPANIGWRNKNEGNLQLSFDPFQVEQTLFYSHDRFTNNVRCEANRVYFYRAWSGEAPGQTAAKASGTVQIEARSLPDFRLLWAGKVPLDDVQRETQPRSIEIRSIQPTPTGVAIELHNVDTGRWTKVQLPDVSTQ
jgi:hypothetical protein